MNKTAILLLILALVLLSSCAKEQAKLTILTESYPPITFAVGDSITGYATDVVRALQSKLESQDEIVLTEWSEAYKRAQDEENIILFSMEQTEERKDLFNWIGPLGNHTSSLYVKRDSTLKIENLEAAKKLKSIATTTSWFTEKYLQSQGFTNLSSNVKPGDAVKAVMNGSSEATILSDLVAQDIIYSAGYDAGSLIPVLEVLKTDYYITISKKTKPGIVDKWQKAFRELEESGELDKIRKIWFE